MKYVVELHTATMRGPRVERWCYDPQELALCRVTQLLIVHPLADLHKRTIGLGANGAETIYTLVVP
jgi:hypothetical protein